MSEQWKPRPGSEPMRSVALALAAAVVLAAAIAGPRHTAAPATPTTALMSSVAREAQSASWACSGGTAGDTSTLPSALVFDNAGSRPVRAVADLVASDGHHVDQAVAIPAGATATLDEDVPGASAGSWVSALVTVFGPMTTVSQDIWSRWGRTSQPCASATSARWYFPDGFDLRNAWEFLTLVNPYPQDEIVDVSFTTEFGREIPGDYQGVVVPARGMALLGLRDHLRRRAHIAATVKARTGGVVAFETELVTTPPKSAPRVGAPGAVNPVAPVAGVTLMLGAMAPARQLWWPSGGQAPGITEDYFIYNPQSRPSRAVIRLYNPATGGSGAVTADTHSVSIRPYGWVKLTSDGQPWAMPNTDYAVQLQAVSGAPLVAERAVTAAAPAHERGSGVALGELVSSRSWALPCIPLKPIGALPPTATVQLYNPGPKVAVAEVEGLSGGALSPLAGLENLAVASGQRVSAVLPVAAQHSALVLQSSQPVVVSEDAVATRPARGVDLSPGLPVVG